MSVLRLTALLPFVLGVFALPQSMSLDDSEVTTTTLSATLTVSITSTAVTTVPADVTTTTSTIPSSTTSAPPHYSAFVVTSYRRNSPIHLLPMNAAGGKFWLGGSPSIYCPTVVQDFCPTANVTGFYNGCALADEVPGGQQVYAAPDGSLSFTQAHSAYIPTGSVICPIGFDETDSLLYETVVNAFGSQHLMACPTSDVSYGDRWQVFVALKNATVPNGNVSSCLRFDALAFEHDLGNNVAAAWQYA